MAVIHDIKAEIGRIHRQLTALEARSTVASQADLEQVKADLATLKARAQSLRQQQQRAQHLWSQLQQILDPTPPD